MAKKFVYCIKCEAWFEYAILPVWGEVHQIDIPLYNDRGEIEGSDKELCYFEGGYAHSSPPEFDPHWNLSVTPPGDDEVLVMDVQSLVLVEA